MKNWVVRIVILGGLLALGFGSVIIKAQNRIPLMVITDKPTITITNATATSTGTPTTGIHAALVQFKFGTVVGSYTGCTVQAQTAPDGGTYLTLGSAQSVTVSTGALNVWGLAESAITAPSGTVSTAFGTLTSYVFACSGYGTSAPVVISVIYSPTAIGGGVQDVNIISGVVQDAAEGTAAGTTPALIGVRATTSENVAVGDGTAVRMPGDKLGRPVLVPYAVPEMRVEGRTATSITDTTSTQVVAAVASYYIYITGVYIQNASSSVGTWLNLQDGSGGTSIGPPIYAGTNGGGGRVTIDPPLKLTLSTGLYIAAETTGASYRVWAVGFKSAY